MKECRVLFYDPNFNKEIENKDSETEEKNIKFKKKRTSIPQPMKRYKKITEYIS